MRFPSRPDLQLVFVALLLISISASLTFAQQSPFSVASAKRDATHLNQKLIQVHGHFWWGKEGSMIYDSGYKAILKVQYSDKFNRMYPHPYQELFPAYRTRKSNLATITGRLQPDTNGRIVLTADDIVFEDKR